MNPVHFSKRIHYLLLIFLAMLVLLLHYPLTPHELGFDSFYIHALGETITNHGYATWVVHPLSYMGFFPDSYPAAVPFVISCASQLSGLSMEVAIYFVSLIFALLGLLGMYMLAGAFWNDDRFKFLVAFGYATSPLIIRYTNWSMSTRGLFLVILPILLWLVVQGKKTMSVNKLGFTISAVLLLILLAFVHRMFWSALIIVSIYHLVMWMDNLTRKKLAYRQYTPKAKRIMLFSLLALLGGVYLVLFFVLGSTTLPLVGGLVSPGMLEGLVSFKTPIFLFLLLSIFLSVFFWMMSGERRGFKHLAALCIVGLAICMFFIQFTDLAAWRNTWWLSWIVPGGLDNATTMGIVKGLGTVMGARIGIFIIPALMGIVLLPFLRVVEVNRIFLVVTFLVLFPFFHIVMYVYESIAPLFFLVGALIILLSYVYLKRWLKRPKMNALVTVLVFAFLVGSIVFTAYSIHVRNTNITKNTEELNYLPEYEYSGGLYMKEYRDDADIVASRRMHAIWGGEPVVNASNVEITRKEAPAPLDFPGWFSYFRAPLLSEVHLPPIECHYFYSKSIPPFSEQAGYQIYNNGKVCLNYDGNI